MAKVQINDLDAKMLLDVIRHAERWFASEGITLYLDGRYPRLDVAAKFRDGKAQYQAWHVDALMSCAYYIAESHTKPHEFVVALRCYAQACEYKGRCVDLADASWYDEHLRIRILFDNIVGAAFSSGT